MSSLAVPFSPNQIVTAAVIATVLVLMLNAFLIAQTLGVAIPGLQ